MMPPRITVSPLFTRTVVFADRFVQVGPTLEDWDRDKASVFRADASW